MGYPPFLLRRTSFRQAESAGQDLSTANIDGEHNDFVSVVNEINRRLRLITSASGALINVATQISQALVGAERFTAVDDVTFTTTMAWDSSFSNLNVLVVANGETVDPDTVAVANSGGFLAVTVDDAVTGWVVVAAYSQGAGIEARLLDTDSTTTGASMVGVHDVDGNFSSVTVEGALAELASALDQLIAQLGTIGSIWTKSGTSLAGDPADDDWDLGSQRITNLADAVDANDAVTLQQLQALTQGISDLIALFIRADGTVDFTANQSMGGFKLTDLGTPSDATDATNKTYVDTLPRLATDGLKSGAALGTLIGPVDYGQDATDSADADQSTTPATVVVPTLFGLAKPSQPGQAVNKQYVDEQIAGLGIASNLRSPYAAFLMAQPAYGTDALDLDTAITNITAGGVLMGTSLAVSVPSTVTADVHIFVDGNASISGAITATGKVVEISATGDVTVSAAISAQDIRIRAGGTITVSAALTADSELGIVVLDSLTELDVSAAVNGLLIFFYVAGDITVSATVRAKGGQTAAGAFWYSPQWNSAQLGADPDNTALHITTVGFGRGLGSIRAVISDDYMTRYAGIMPVFNDGDNDSGGSGAVAGGKGRKKNSGGLTATAAPARGASRPWLFPAAPGGPGGPYNSSGPSSAEASQAGGVIVVVATGDADFSGGTFDASGADGVSAGRSAGGGGTVKVCVRGEVTDGDFNAAGGHGFGTSDDGGGGGGGTAFVVTGTAAAGVQSFDVAGGENGNNGIFAEDGVSGTAVLADTDTWDTLRDQGYFDK